MSHVQAAVHAIDPVNQETLPMKEVMLNQGKGEGEENGRGKRERNRGVLDRSRKGMLYDRLTKRLLIHILDDAYYRGTSGDPTPRQDKQGAGAGACMVRQDQVNLI